jgi:predicted transcriptional regulator
LGSYRGRLDIIADILHIARGKAKKTQIMYQANLSYKVLQRYLKDILEASLVSFEDAEQNYVLTRKGHEFLETYKEYSRANKSIEKRLSEIGTKKKLLEGMCRNKQDYVQLSTHFKGSVDH